MVSEEKKTDGAMSPPAPPTGTVLDPINDCWIVGDYQDFAFERAEDLASECIFRDLNKAIEKAKRLSCHLVESFYIWHWPEGDDGRTAVAIALQGCLYMQGEWEAAIADWAIAQAEIADWQKNQPSPTNGLRSAFPWMTPGEGGPGDFVMEPGLTKREAIAIMALQGLLSGAVLQYDSVSEILSDAVRLADLLLEGLAK